MKLTESQRQTITNALYTAAAQYKKDSASLVNGDYRPIGGIKTDEQNSAKVVKSMARQFTDQAKQAVKLAEILEDSAEIEVKLL